MRADISVSPLPSGYLVLSIVLRLGFGGWSLFAGQDLKECRSRFLDYAQCVCTFRDRFRSTMFSMLTLTVYLHDYMEGVMEDRGSHWESFGFVRCRCRILVWLIEYSLLLFFCRTFSYI